jgi:hypothetical protein
MCWISRRAEEDLLIMGNEEVRTTRRELLGDAIVAGAAAVWPSIPECCGIDDKSSELRIIDSHVHVWKNDPHYPWPKEETKPPKADALPSTLLGLMAANGVAKTVIVHVIHYRWDCRYAGDTIKAHPDRFMGVCRVDPAADRAVEELNHWVRDYGFHGVRLSPAAGASGDWINDRERMDRICGRAAELKIRPLPHCPGARRGAVD